MECLLVVGNPVDGFIYVGPFTDMEDATHYAEGHITAYWWVAELETAVME